MSKHEKNALKSRFVVTRRHAIIGGLMVGAAGVAGMRQPELRYPVVDGQEFIDWVPDRFDGWTNSGAGDVVLPPPDALRERLYDNLISRTYLGPQEAGMMALLAYNNKQDGMLQVHRPEVCYPVGGYTLIDKAPTDLEMGENAIPSSSFTAVSEDRTEHVLYFIRLGTRFPRTWAEQRTVVIEANLRGFIPDGMMFRVSTLMRDRDAAFEAMRAFAQGFFQASSPPLQKLLAG